MVKKMTAENEEKSIDFHRLMGVLLNKSWLIVLIAILCVVLVLLGTYFLVAPKYEAAALFYVNNNSLAVGDASFSISSGDLTTSRSLVESYIVILHSRETLVDVIDCAGVDRTYMQVREMLYAEAVNNTEVFQVVVTSEDPNEAEQIANAIAEILPKRISSIIEGTSAKVVDSAIVPTKPSAPNYTINAIISFLLGLVLSIGVIVLREIFDITIRSEEDVTQCCKHPILAEVPDMLATPKGGNYYSGRYGRNKYGAYVAGKQRTALMGSGISFAAAEAYKMLRTKLQFSFADDNDCRIIGLSSALSGEGKSLSAVNLAYTLSQLNKKVLLIDCDMRRPTLAEKLRIMKNPGLSNLLTGQVSLERLVQDCGLRNEETAFHVITAGQNPPNPVELLSSAKMEKLLDDLRKMYDYVIIDLPPVGEVTDAMAMAKQIDGMLMIVRQNYCNRVVLAEAVQQFEFIDTRILGVVFNCTCEHTGKYGKKYYKRYYKRYGKNYSQYERNDRTVASAETEGQQK